MNVKKIDFLTDLSMIEDIEDYNIDVLVELEDGFTCVVVVSTPKNYYWYMEKENVNHYCGVPDIIVKKITEEIVTEAIKDYAKDDAYWLKSYYLPGVIDIETLNQLIKTIKEDQA